MYIYILRDFKETALRNIEKVVDGITNIIPCKGGVYYAVSIPEVEDEVPNEFSDVQILKELYREDLNLNYNYYLVKVTNSLDLKSLNNIESRIDLNVFLVYGKEEPRVGEVLCKLPITEENKGLDSLYNELEEIEGFYNEENSNTASSSFFANLKDDNEKITPLTPKDEYSSGRHSLDKSDSDLFLEDDVMDKFPTARELKLAYKKALKDDKNFLLRQKAINLVSAMSGNFQLYYDIETNRYKLKSSVVKYNGIVAFSKEGYIDKYNLTDKAREFGKNFIRKENEFLELLRDTGYGGIDLLISNNTVVKRLLPFLVLYNSFEEIENERMKEFNTKRLVEKFNNMIIRGQAFNESYRIEDIVPKLRPVFVQLSELSDKAPSVRFIKILLADSILTDIDKMSVDEIIIKHIKGKYRADVNAIIATAKRLLEEPYNKGFKELLGVVNPDAVDWVLKNPTIDDGIKEIIKKSL